jgi:hypothetical protein
VDPPTDAASELVQTGENSGKGASLLRATNRNSFNKFFRFRLKKKKEEKKTFLPKRVRTTIAQRNSFSSTIGLNCRLTR